MPMNIRSPRLRRFSGACEFRERDSRRRVEYPEGIPYIRVGDLRDGEVRRPTLVLYTEPDPSHRLRAGDLLVSLGGTVGKVAVVPSGLDGAVASADLAAVRPSPSLLPGFLAALLWTVPYQRWLTGHAGGTTVQYLSIRELRGLPILVPSEDVQRRLLGALRPGDDQGHILAFLTETDENPFALAIATEPLLRDLDEIPWDRPDDALGRAIELQNRLWDLAVETGAMSS